MNTYNTYSVQFSESQFSGIALSQNAHLVEAAYLVGITYSLLQTAKSDISYRSIHGLSMKNTFFVFFF